MAGEKQESKFQMITPPNTLKAKVKILGSGEGVDMEAVARAEAAISELSVEFDAWLSDEVERLGKAQERASKEGMTGEAAHEFFRVSHDLKGQAGTFGYPLVTDTCASLCRLFDSMNDLKSQPDSVVKKFTRLAENHVYTVRALVSGKIKDVSHPMGKKLTAELYSTTVKFIERFLPKEQDEPPKDQNDQAKENS